MVNRLMIENIYRRDLGTVPSYGIGRTGKMVRDNYRLRSIDDRTKRASCKNVSESQNRGFV